MCDFEWDHSDESKWVWEAAVQETQGYHHYVETRAWLCGPVFTSVNALPDVEAGLFSSYWGSGNPPLAR